MITKTLSDMLEAAEQAADWLCDATPNTDQWERGTRLRKAMHAFRKSQGNCYTGIISKYERQDNPEPS